MHKKIILFVLAITLILANVNAYETTVQISVIEDIIPVEGTFFEAVEGMVWLSDPFYHWITLDWTYTGPTTGDQSWRECDFESPDKDYGIFLVLNKYFGQTHYLKEDFGPTTSTPKCEDYYAEGYAECTARTTYFFKMSSQQFTETNNPSINKDFSIPINIKGKCGVIEIEPQEEPYNPKTVSIGESKYSGGGQDNLKEKKEIKKTKIMFDSPSLYPIDMNYDYNFTMNQSYLDLAPEISVTTRWGKISSQDSPETINAILSATVNDPQNRNLTGADWVMPADCEYIGTPTASGIGTPSAEAGLELKCFEKGIKLLIFYASNQDGFLNFQPFFSYFSTNNNEAELELEGNYEMLIDSPNVGPSEIKKTLVLDSGSPSWIEYNGEFQHFNYRLAQTYPKTWTIIKDTGNGLGEETNYAISVENSSPFVSVLEPVCPYLESSYSLENAPKGLDSQYGEFYYKGEDFKIIRHGSFPSCEPGIHQLKITSTGTSPTEGPYSLTQNLNFIALDIDVQVLGMKTNQENSWMYGLAPGENRKIDLNITIDNYSPEYTTITDISFYHKDAFSSLFTCTSEETDIIEETSNNWKINSNLKCTGPHVFSPIVYFNNRKEFAHPANLVFWGLEPTDKFKMNSVTIENMHDQNWNPDTNEICNPKTGNCSPIMSEDVEDVVTILLILPGETTTINKGDLLRFHSTIMNFYSMELGAHVIIKITDPQGNEVAEIYQITGGVDSMKTQELNLLFYDTDFIKENTLYTVTSTVYWMPSYGFKELDIKPLNNTKITFFYVLGNNNLISNLPETNFISALIALAFVILILRKK